MIVADNNSHNVAIFLKSIEEACISAGTCNLLFSGAIEACIQIDNCLPELWQGNVEKGKRRNRILFIDFCELFAGLVVPVYLI